MDELEGDFGGSPQTSIGLVHGAGVTVRDSILDGPVWDLGAPIVPGYEGVQGARRVTVAHNVVDEGIWVTTTDGGSVTNNAVTGGGIELILDGSGSALIAGNETVADTTPDAGRSGGLSLQGGDGTGIIVRDNTVRGGDNLGVGINLGPGSPVLEGNDIRGARVGILVPDGGTPTIRSSVIEGAQSGIIVNGVSTAPVIEGNRFCGNDRDLVVPDGSTLSLDASNVICP